MWPCGLSHKTSILSSTAVRTSKLQSSWRVYCHYPCVMSSEVWKILKHSFRGNLSCLFDWKCTCTRNFSYTVDLYAQFLIYSGPVRPISHIQWPYCNMACILEMMNCTVANVGEECTWCNEMRLLCCCGWWTTYPICLSRQEFWSSWDLDLRRLRNVRTRPDLPLFRSIRRKLRTCRTVPH